MKDSIPSEVIIISLSSSIENTNELPSASEAVIVAIVLIFSSISKVELDVNIGGLSLRLFIEIVISLVTVTVPSNRDKVIVYELLVS